MANRYSSPQKNRHHQKTHPHGDKSLWFTDMFTDGRPYLYWLTIRKNQQKPLNFQELWSGT